MFEKILPYAKFLAKDIIKTAVAGAMGILTFMGIVSLFNLLDKLKKNNTRQDDEDDYIKNGLTSVISLRSAIFAFSLTGLAIDKVSDAVSSYVSK